MQRNVYMAAKESNAFELEQQTLTLVRGGADFAARAYDSLPGQAAFGLS